MTTKVVCHYSCGSTSAVATMMALDKYGHDNVEIIYADPGAEHPDNLRFLKDCETKLFFNKRVTIVRSAKYKTIFDVFEKNRFLSGPGGAKCTTEMKKIPIRDYLGTRLVTELQVFGFDAGEKHRVKRFKDNNPEVTLVTPLFDANITKREAMNILSTKGVDLPEMYKLGFSNANCIGCVKADNLGYWSKIRKLFPDTYDWYKRFERQIGAKDSNGKRKGATINRPRVKGVRTRVFLDEIPVEQEQDGQLDFWCGYSCGAPE